MEHTHLSSQLEYLDRKQQDNGQRLAKLLELNQAQEQELQDQAHRIQKLEEELAEARAKLGQMPQLDDQLIRFKNELLQMMEERYQRRQQSVQEISNTLTSQIGSQTRALNELRREVEKTQRYDEQISLARIEVERLNKEVGTFQARLETLDKRGEERQQAVVFLEEQRRVDMRKLVELQAELPEVHKKIENNLSKVQMVEGQIPQFGKYELALEQIREEMRRHRDHMDFQIAQRERQIKDWTGLADSHERRVKEVEGLMEKYTEHYQLNRRALESLQNFQERLQREQHQAGELQRLSEERQRVELEKWQAEYEQRWKKQSIEWKPQFAELQKQMDGLQKRMDESIKAYRVVTKQLDLILQIVEEDVQARILAASDWQQRFEELANGKE